MKCFLIVDGSYIRVVVREEDAFLGWDAVRKPPAANSANDMSMTRDSRLAETDRLAGRQDWGHGQYSQPVARLLTAHGRLDPLHMGMGEATIPTPRLVG